MNSAIFWKQNKMTTSTIKISELSSLASVSDTTVFPAVDSGSTKKTTALAIKTYIGGNAGPSGPQGPSGAEGPTGPQGIEGPTGPSGPALPGYYGSFYSTSTQTAIGGTGTQAMIFDQTYEANGVSINNTQIVVANTGTYNLQFSSVFNKVGSNAENIDIWLKKNGNDVNWTNTVITLSGNNARSVASWNFVLSLEANDALELYWWTNDATVEMLALDNLSNPSRPSVPSVIATVTQIK